MLLNTTLSSFGELLVFISLSYSAPYLFLQYGLPKVLTIFGFGSTGISLKSIASRIQYKYGVSDLFSLLQSIGARGGTLYPKFWSGIIGTTCSLVASWTKWSGDHKSFVEANTSKQTQGDYTIFTTCLTIFIYIILYFWWRPNNLQQITTNRTVRVNRQTHQHPQRLPNTLVPTLTRNRNSPLKLIELLHPNPSGDYSCPECKRNFKAQGITNHVKSCAKEWCITNGIRITESE